MTVSLSWLPEIPAAMETMNFVTVTNGDMGASAFSLDSFCPSI
jgi:hypothetical protein